MVVSVRKRQSTVTIKILSQRGSVTLDMSLQRHAYAYLAASEPKPMNSMLHGAVSQLQIEADLLQLGQLVEQKLQRLGQPAKFFVPGLIEQLAGVRAGMDAGLGIRDSFLRMENGIDSFCDFRVASGRTYRVDNSANSFTLPPNHCYPIAGPKVWAQINQLEFAGIVMFRRIERMMERKGCDPDDLAARRMALHSDPDIRDCQLIDDIDSAAMQFGKLPLPSQRKIVTAAGNSPLQRRLARFLRMIAGEKPVGVTPD